MVSIYWHDLDLRPANNGVSFVFLLFVLENGGVKPFRLFVCVLFWKICLIIDEALNIVVFSRCCSFCIEMLVYRICAFSLQKRFAFVPTPLDPGSGHLLQGFHHS